MVSVKGLTVIPLDTGFSKRGGKKKSPITELSRRFSVKILVVTFWKMDLEVNLLNCFSLLLSAFKRK